MMRRKNVAQRKKVAANLLLEDKVMRDDNCAEGDECGEAKSAKHGDTKSVWESEVPLRVKPKVLPKALDGGICEESQTAYQVGDASERRLKLRLRRRHWGGIYKRHRY